MRKRNVIITACDQKYGDFLINHWLKSLQTNVDLTDCDIAVIDYGLLQSHISALINQKCIVITGLRSGHIVTQRFIDAEQYLINNHYDQVLFIDSGDIIFQGDISHVFNENKDSFRAVKLDMEVMFFEAFIPRNFTSQVKKQLWKVLQGKAVLNAGVIFAPTKKFIYMCNQIRNMVSKKDIYGPDQIIVNYILHQEKVELLSKVYNFIPGTEREGFVLKKGIFYRKNGEKLLIVHNAGHDNMLRPIGNFGYGYNNNQLKYGIYYGRRLIFSFFRLIRIIQMKLRLFF